MKQYFLNWCNNGNRTTEMQRWQNATTRMPLNKFIIAFYAFCIFCQKIAKEFSAKRMYFNIIVCITQSCEQKVIL